MSSNNFFSLKPFRRAVVRGLGIILPPLLTIVIFLWVGGTINNYVLKPVEAVVRNVIAIQLDNGVRKSIPGAEPGQMVVVDPATSASYHRLANNEFVPLDVYNKVRITLGELPMPTTGKAMYRRYVEVVYLTPQRVVPVFIVVFVLAMYLFGKFLAAGIGRFFLDTIEKIIHRLPIIRNVYSAVKQVTDFIFSEREMEYTRVVAIEYPRRGVWSFGLVTGESLLDIRSAANEPVVSLLIPSSPAPVTGYTVTVKKSETVDLNMTIDEAFQFIVSCGVVVPPHQMQEVFEQQAEKEAAVDQVDNAATSRLPAPTPSPTADT